MYEQLALVHQYVDLDDSVLHPMASSEMKSCPFHTFSLCGLFLKAIQTAVCLTKLSIIKKKKQKSENRTYKTSYMAAC